tara:strand:+ start:4201 stop:5769 length:1569 start_codon:yes stop_codon:yes gene_type:complete
MVEIKNPGHISTLTKTAGVPGTKVVDSTDFIHSGLIKALSQMSRGNFAVGNGASASDMGFKMTQTDVGGKTQIVVTTGKIFRDGAYQTVPTETFLSNGTTSVQSPAVSLTYFDDVDAGGVAYFLLVADTTPELQIRGNKTILNKVPDYTAGDTIIALIKMDSADADVAARYVQYLTTDKTSNSLSIGYENSNAYAEAASLTGSSDGLAIQGVTSLKQASGSASGQIRFYDDDNSHYSGFAAAATTTGNSVYSMPAALPGSNKLLQTSAAGALSWVDTIGNYVSDISVGTGLDVTHTPSAGSTATVNLDLTEVIATDGVNRLLTSDGDGTLTGEANATFNSGALAVTGSIAATTSVTGASVTGTATLISGKTYVQGPLVNAIVSGPASSGGTPITAQLTIDNIQWLEVHPNAGPTAGHQYYQLPDANGLASGTTITLKNLSAETAVIQISAGTAGQTIEGGQIPAALPVGIVIAPNIIVLPGLRSVTLASYTDGGIVFANPSLEFGGAPVFTGTVGWVILSAF